VLSIVSTDNRFVRNHRPPAHCVIDCLRCILSKVASYGVKQMTDDSSTYFSFRTKLQVLFNKHILLCFSDNNECSPNPCRKGGTCTEGENSYTCNCVAGYNGVNCQTSKSATNENCYLVYSRHLQHESKCPYNRECIDLFFDFLPDLNSHTLWC